MLVKVILGIVAAVALLNWALNLGHGGKFFAAIAVTAFAISLKIEKL